MTRIHAIFQNGVFVPRERVDLPERTEVTFDPRPVRNPWDEARVLAAMKGIVEILNQRVASGESDVAARHNEHQP